ncbi:glutamate decarboxylase gad1 [Paramarasmius palmivorus]|uniref:glutamate decarboxylase n=1 Tax=Paramarasmius palmivorus TaxID=297713 RepID=A0AAW0B8E2_9AGAR
MSLSRHINPDEVIQKSRDHPHVNTSQTSTTGRRSINPGAAMKMLKESQTYQLLHDETALDGNPLLNLASFVHTWMPEYADKLIMENINKNQVDLDEYPAATNIHNRVYLYEYFDVECRLVPVKASNNYVLDPKDAIQYIDENTIGVIVILGSTYTGHFENVLEMSELLDQLQKDTGLDIPIHVDGASGAFIAPFVYPSLKWGFDIPRVVSINTSGHKFGLVYAGLGWVLWRDESYLHKDLVFELHYLGSVEYSFTLNFSKPAAPIIAQMFNFLNLGFEGYRKIAIKDLRNARLLSRALENTYFKVLSNVHRLREGRDEDDDPESYEFGLPVVAFKFSDDFVSKYPYAKQMWVQALLRAKGWIVPNYGAPEGEKDTEILRVVVRETLSEDLIERLVADIIEITESMMDEGGAQMLEKTTKTIHQPEKEHGRPVKDNFGGEEEGQKQAGFSRQC